MLTTPTPTAFYSNGKIYTWSDAIDVTATFHGIFQSMSEGGQRAFFESGIEPDTGERFFNCLLVAP